MYRTPVVLLNGKPDGRLWVAPDNGELPLIDIAVHPKLQGKGIGTVLVQRLPREAAKSRLLIRCCVFRFNPGFLRFHRGFCVAREDQTHDYIEWRPSTVGANYGRSSDGSETAQNRTQGRYQPRV